MKISAATKQTVTYQVPRTKRELIGTRPQYEFRDNDKVKDSYVRLPDPQTGGSQAVFASQPLRDSHGEIQYEQREAEVDLTPRSSLWNGLGWGFGASLVGGLAGLVTGEMVAGAPGLGALIGAVGAGTVTGAAVAYSVGQEKTELVWDEHSIYQHEMKGYHQLAGLGEKGGERGFFHRFVPEVESTPVGSYKTPRVVRYKGENVPPALPSAAWPKVETEVEPATPDRAIDLEVSYNKGHLQSRYVGTIPWGYHSSSSATTGYTECGPQGCRVDGGRNVHRKLPVYEPNGDARVDTVTARFEERASSVVGNAAVGGVVGAIPGVLAGMTGALLGLNPALSFAGGITLGAGIGAYVGGRSASDDRVRLEWRESPVEEGKMVGYQHSSSTHYKNKCEREYNWRKKEWETKCRRVADGYDHYFSPKFEKWPVGATVKPVVVHYSAKEEAKRQAS